MAYVHILCEGQAEEVFVKHSLAPFLERHGVFAKPVVLRTKRILEGGTFRGGVSKYSKIRNDVRDLLGNPNYYVTTLLDYYGLPSDFPALGPRGTTPAFIYVEQLEAAFGADIGSDRFLPFLALHEFEAWVFVEPAEVAREFGNDSIRPRIQAVRDAYASPEDINDGANTHPSHRLANICPGFSKTRNGPQIISRTGITAIAAICPHMSIWIANLAAL